MALLRTASINLGEMRRHVRPPPPPHFAHRHAAAVCVVLSCSMVGLTSGWKATEAMEGNGHLLNGHRQVQGLQGDATWQRSRQSPVILKQPRVSLLSYFVKDSFLWRSHIFHLSSGCAAYVDRRAAPLSASHPASVPVRIRISRTNLSLAIGDAFAVVAIRPEKVAH